MFWCLVQWWVYAWWPRSACSAVGDKNSGESFSMCVSGWPWMTRRQKSTCSSARWKRLYSCLLWKNIQTSVFLLDWVPSLRLRCVLRRVACCFFFKLTENLCLHFKSFTPAFYPGFCAFPSIPRILNWFNHINASRILIHNLQRSGGAVVSALALKPRGPEAFLCGVCMLASCLCGFSPGTSLCTTYTLSDCECEGLFISVCWPLRWSGDLSRSYPASHPKAA